MIINFKSIKLKNFVSFKDEEIIFDNYQGFINIFGSNKSDDTAKSNGSGKSSLFNSICWCLTGQTIQGSKKVENIFCSGETKVELNFVLDNKNYTILRSKNPSNLKIFLDDKDISGKGIRDTEKIVKELLPDIETIISSVVILGQGLPNRFTNNSPTGRKEVLEKLSKSDFMIEDIKDKLSNRQKELKLVLRNNEDKQLKLKTILSTKKELLQQLAKQYKSFDYGTLKTQLDELKKSDIKIIQIDSTELNSLIDKQLSLKVSDYEVKDTKEFEKELIEHQTTLKSLKSKKKDLMNGICPTCGKEVDALELEENDTEICLLEQKISEINEKIVQINKENKESENKAKEEYQKKFDTISNKIKNLQAEQSKLQKENEKKLSTLNKIKELEYAISSLDEKKNSIKEQGTQVKKECAKLEKEISKIDTKVYEDKLDIIRKMSNIASRDFRGYLLTNVISFIQDRLVHYSNFLLNTDNIKFELDGNNLQIYLLDKEYEMLSGGEKQVIDIMVQLSIRDMLCTYFNFSTNILVIDEITDNLDSNRAEKVFELLSKLDLESIFVISHHEDYNIPFDRQIKVEKDKNNISRIISM
jgi:putative exonuclease